MPNKKGRWQPPDKRRTEGESQAPTSREERRAEAERRRKELRRKATRRRRIKGLALVTGFLVVAGGATTGVILLAGSGDKGQSEEEIADSFKQFLAQYDQAVEAAGCTDVQKIKPYLPVQQNDRRHITTGEAPPLSSYPSQPPASGPHDPTPLHEDVYDSPPDIYAAIHSLEHGAVEIWYPPSAADDPQLQRIKDFFGDPVAGDHVIVAPYDYDEPGGTLPDDRQMVLVAWHRMQSCDQPNISVAGKFVYDLRADLKHPGRYKGEAPEAGGLI
jgi:hypothetical protein